MSIIKISIIFSGILLCFSSCKQLEANTVATPEKATASAPAKDSDILAEKPVINVIDTVLFDSLQMHLSGNRKTDAWPVKTEYPIAGAILPYKRIIAYYGNFYSKGMGILGALPEDKVLQKLQDEAKRWQEADSAVPVQTAIHYIAVTAQHDPGKRKQISHSYARFSNTESD